MIIRNFKLESSEPEEKVLKSSKEIVEKIMKGSSYSWSIGHIEGLKKGKRIGFICGLITGILITYLMTGLL